MYCSYISLAHSFEFVFNAPYAPLRIIRYSNYTRLKRTQRTGTRARAPNGHGAVAPRRSQMTQVEILDTIYVYWQVREASSPLTRGWHVGQSIAFLVFSQKIFTLPLCGSDFLAIK